MATALVIPATASGTDASLVVPLPSWPNPLSPQQRTDPEFSRAHECMAPDVIWVMPVSGGGPVAPADEPGTTPVSTPRTRASVARAPPHLARTVDVPLRVAAVGVVPVVMRLLPVRRWPRTGHWPKARLATRPV